MFKNIGQMMKQAQQLQSKMQEAQERIARTEADGAAGGGLVKVMLSGNKELKSIKIDPSLLKAEEVDILEDLIIAAHSDALRKIEAICQDEMSEASGGLNLPSGLKLPF